MKLITNEIAELGSFCSESKTFLKNINYRCDKKVENTIKSYPSKYILPSLSSESSVSTIVAPMPYKSLLKLEISSDEQGRKNLAVYMHGSMVSVLARIDHLLKKSPELLKKDKENLFFIKRENKVSVVSFSLGKYEWWILEHQWDFLNHYRCPAGARIFNFVPECGGVEVTLEGEFKKELVFN